MDAMRARMVAQWAPVSGLFPTRSVPALASPAPPSTPRGGRPARHLPRRRHAKTRLHRHQCLTACWLSMGHSVNFALVLRT